jgi:hypothetical protein
MNKLIISVALVLAFTSCKGPGSGPLVRESFKEGQVPTQPMEPKNHMGKVDAERINIIVEPCADCVTIAKLFENKQSYSGKIIRVKGQVTKFNPEIMGKNWIHIQDGTEFQGGFDLTVTSGMQAEVGKIVTIEGKIVLDKDFGYGYSYSVLMEEGKIQ